MHARKLARFHTNYAQINLWSYVQAYVHANVPANTNTYTYLLKKTNTHTQKKHVIYVREMCMDAYSLGWYDGYSSTKRMNAFLRDLLRR